MVFFLFDSPPPGNYLGIQRHLLSLSQVHKSLNHHLLLGNKKYFLYLMMGQNQLVFRFLAFQGLRNHCKSHLGNAMQQSHRMVGASLVPLVPSVQGNGPGSASHRPELALSLK